MSLCKPLIHCFCFCFFQLGPRISRNTMYSITKFIVVALFGLMTSAVPTPPAQHPLSPSFPETYNDMKERIEGKADTCADYAIIFARGTFDNSEDSDEG